MVCDTKEPTHIPCLVLNATTIFGAGHTPVPHRKWSICTKVDDIFNHWYSLTKLTNVANACKFCFKHTINVVRENIGLFNIYIYLYVRAGTKV